MKGSNPKESEYNYDYYRESKTQSNSYITTNNNTLISNTKLGPAQQQIEIRYIYELKGLFFTNPLLSLSLCISLFSMAGIPPVKNYGKILYWEKLSNSGDTLKFMIPNYIRKAICG
jgi:NADH:ubiquinone oxidoreductase subunit 2 (subunit N)